MCRGKGDGNVKDSVGATERAADVLSDTAYGDSASSRDRGPDRDGGGAMKGKGELHDIALEEAKSLSVGIDLALAEMRRARPHSCQEDEVGFRFDALIGMLIMAQNDVWALEANWKAND